MSKSPDPLKRIKYIAYCRSNTPPGEGLTLESLIEFAKFYLCSHSKRLWKDPIWDSYTNEDILVEYFSLLFQKDEKARNEFEISMNLGTELYGEDVYSWLDRKVKENQKEMEAQVEALEDRISFKPDVLEE